MYLAYQHDEYPQTYDQTDKTTYNQSNKNQMKNILNQLQEELKFNKEEDSDDQILKNE